MNKYEEIITMKCERCKTPTRSMVCLPRRRRKDGTAICFWQVCVKCAKEILAAKRTVRVKQEILYARKKVRDSTAIRIVPKMSTGVHNKSRLSKKSNVLCKVQRVVRGVKNGSKKINTRKKASRKKL